MTGASPPACTGEPLSWLLLERHALGELSAREARRVRAHLARCAACAACAAEAGGTLAIAPVTAPVAAPPRPSWWRRYAVGWATTAALACAAAGFLLAARVRIPSPSAPLASDTLPGVKGGDVALELVREREGTITHGADSFAPADRWKVLVTCPAGHVLFWDVVVREGERARFPLAPAGPITCGNHVTLPGAFRLSGSAPVQVCLRLTADPVPREPSSNATAEHLCLTVRPES